MIYLTNAFSLPMLPLGQEHYRVDIKHVDARYVGKFVEAALYETREKGESVIRNAIANKAVLDLAVKEIQPYVTIPVRFLPNRLYIQLLPEDTMFVAQITGGRVDSDTPLPLGVELVWYQVNITL